MLIGGIALGLLAGLLLGGRVERLAEIRLRLLPLLFIAVVIRFGTELGLGAGITIAESYRQPLFALAYALLMVALWRNRTYPGLALAFVGITSNAVVILVNGGYMPVWMPAYSAAGFTEPLSSVLHTQLQVGTTPEFFLHLGPLADLIPIPVPFVRNVASLGDLFLTAGLAFFLLASVVRVPPLDLPQLDADEVLRRIGVSGSGLAPGLEEAATLQRPLVLGSAAMGMASPASTTPAAILAPPLVRRVREHPYVRLALNGSFSALWVGQLISLFGDRVNQLALIAFVYELTDSAIVVGITFVVSTLPNLVFSPIAGTFVDRWDQKQVLVVSDILRASLVLMVPVAILINVWLAFPLVFLVTTVSIFFRPARVAILPRIVEERDLLAANSAMWVGETIGDLTYAFAGLFVVFLASSLPLAFWFDAATYLASALLLATIVVPPITRRVMAAGAGGASAPTPAEAGPATATGSRGSRVLSDLQAGWSFLRRETVLLGNTIQGTAGQLALGVITVASVVLARQLTATPGDEYRATYAFMETAIGVGNLLGGFALGLLSSRVRKGMLIIVAYAVYGLQLMLLGAVGSIPVALGLLLGMGIANMGFIVPSQTLFQERTPPELMGRVVSLRFALVFGGWTLAMGFGGLLIGAFGPGPVISAAGLISLVAGLGGLLVRELREA